MLKFNLLLIFICLNTLFSSSFYLVYKFNITGLKNFFNELNNYQKYGKFSETAHNS